MVARLLVLLALLVFCLLDTAPSVEAQCAITTATIRIDPAQSENIGRVNNPMLVIDGNTTGARFTSVTWTRDGNTVDRNTQVTGGSFFDGGGETVVGTGACESQMYRVALLVSGRLPGMYRYTATNADTPTAAESPVFVLEDPGPPTNIVFSQLSNRRAQATWTASTGASGATYRVYINTMDVETGGTEVTGTTHTTGPLSTGFSLIYRIRATTGTYVSIPAVSDEFFIRDVLAPMVTPSVTATSVTLSLSQPTNSLSVDTYTATLTGITCNGLTGTGSSNGNSVTIGSLEAGIQYSVSVTGTNTVAVLTSPAETTTITTTETAPSGSPGVPTSSAITSTSITITWTEIACLDRNGVITGYTIRYGPVNTSPTTTINHTMVDDRSRQITGLTAFTNYTVSVRGVNSIGPGDYSAESVIMTDEDIPTAVTGLSGTPMLFSVVLTWSEPNPLNGILNTYTIRYSVNGSSEVTMTTRDTTFSIPDLNPNTVVSNIRVRAATGAGDGPDETTEDITTPSGPAQVQNIGVEILSGTSVRVTWDTTGFQGITNFVVYYRRTSNRKRQMNEISVVVSPSANFATIDNLVYGAEYVFDVVARVTGNGQSVEGPRAEPEPIVFTTTPPPTQPQATPAPQSGSPVAAIAGGIIAALAVVALVVFIIFMIFLYRTGRLCFQSGSPKSGSASISAYRYARKTDNEVQENDDEHFYGNVDINFPPNIEEFPENTTAIEGEEVIFKVVVSGKPTPTLTWKNGEKELFSNYTMTVGDDGTLTFLSTEMDQSGVYVLEARNSAGKTDREVKLHIEKEGDDGNANSGKESLNISAIPVDQFGEYVAGNHSSNNRGFRDQFQGLYDGEDKTKTIGLSAEFKKLNRFANITVYDDNRIELSPIPGHEDCQGTFINACYIDGFSKPKKFIASQGPLPKTLVDYWRMIWQEKPPIIVMVTNLKEGNKNKCQQYWPDTGSATYGPFKVMITESVILADFVIRTLQVMLEGSNRPLKLTQFHFTAWPDHGVPDYASPMLAFHRRVLTAHKGKKGPILVHCSAGVGRTGTFMCIDNILEQIKKENVVDIAGAITKIRHQRMKMVQTPDQYIFLHDAILESVRCGDTQINAANLRVVLHKYSKPDPQSGYTTYQSQFGVLDQVSPKASEVVCNSAAKHPEKNRSIKYLPSDKYRVIIKGEAEDYIHASFAHGYKQQKAYIIAENPMDITVPNMLKVLYNRKIGAVVMLTALEEDGQESCARYWPNVNQVTKIGDFEVDLISEEVLNGFTIRNISILHEKTRKAHQVMQFHITCWQPDGLCSNPRSVVDTIEEVAKVQRKTGNRPIFVHCSDTVTRSGMFCALATIIDRCKTEGVVDVFQVVKALRIQKPGAVPTVDNYKMIFEATLTFLDSFDTYANFQN